MTAAPLIEGVKLVRHFGGGRQGLFGRRPLVRAVDGVSLKVWPGETFAIVGESGCGKSTLARLLLRLIEPTSGDVIYDGKTITGLDEDAMRRLRRDMQIIFQDPFSSLNPRMNVGQIVAEPLAVHGLAEGAAREVRVAEILRKVGLRPEHAHRYPHEFSGGQRQRIGIARALASGPRLLIGDEPVSALDVSIRAQIINLLEDLKAEFGLTIILVAHDLAVIRHTSDRVAVMYLGEIVEEGPTDLVFERARHPYTNALLAAIPVPDPAGRSDKPLLEGDPPSPTAPPAGCRFASRCPQARDLCRERHPDLLETADGHAVACHFPVTTPARAPAAASERRRQRIALFAAARDGRTPSSTPQPEVPT